MIDEPGVPLSHFRDYRWGPVGIDITCLDCQHRRVTGVGETIASLQARGVGGQDTGIRELARHVRGSCPQCHADPPRFETRPAWPAYATRGAEAPVAS